MGLFGYKRENKKLKSENVRLKKEVSRLKKRGEEKDNWFKELMSDATRHGSSLGAKHMADRKKYKNGK